MIRLLKKLVLWLESRFPEKVVVLAEDYTVLKARIFALDAEINHLREELKIASSSIEVAVSRLGVVESSAVHKDAVKDLVLATQAIKDEFTSLKASLGMNKVINSDIQAMLNGEPL